VATFIVWGSIGIAHIRFRRALKVQNQDPSILPYRSSFYPYGTYFSVAANIFLVFFQGYTAFLNPFSAKDFVINYILIPVFLILVLGYKFWNKTKWVKLEEMDIWTGRREDAIQNVSGAQGTKPIDKGKLWWKRLGDVFVG
jgi:amino acid transporter